MRTARQQGHAKIGDSHGVVIQNHDVRRLDIAVHNTIGMRIGQPVGDLCGNRCDTINRQQITGIENFAQGTADEEFHGNIGQIIAAPDIVDRNDIWMIQAASGFDFTIKAQLKVLSLFARKPGALHRLYRDRTLDGRIMRLIDHPHSATPDYSCDLVTTKLRKRDKEPVEKCCFGTRNNVPLRRCLILDFRHQAIKKTVGKRLTSPFISKQTPPLTQGSASPKEP